MSFENVSKVYVRVHLPSRKVVSVSPRRLITRKDRPVFQVEANHSRLDYYIVEPSDNATFGITVRAATLEEQTAADENRQAKLTEADKKARYKKGFQIKEFYDQCIIGRFFSRGFYTTTEVLGVANYTGTDTHILDNVMPKALKINEAYNEWRHTVCQPVIDAMFSNEDMGPDLDDDYTTEVQDLLDTFLTERGFDVTVYHR